MLRNILIAQSKWWNEYSVNENLLVTNILPRDLERSSNNVIKSFDYEYKEQMAITKKSHHPGL